MRYAVNLYVDSNGSIDFHVASFDVTVATVWRRAPARVSATTEPIERKCWLLCGRSCPVLCSLYATRWPSVPAASICWTQLILIGIVLESCQTCLGKAQGNILSCMRYLENAMLSTQVTLPFIIFRCSRTDIVMFGLLWLIGFRITND